VDLTARVYIAGMIKTNSPILVNVHKPPYKSVHLGSAVQGTPIANLIIVESKALDPAVFKLWKKIWKREECWYVVLQIDIFSEGWILIKTGDRWVKGGLDW